MAILRKLAPSARALIFSPDRKKVLLVKRRDIPVWELPGGGIEEGETPENNVVREVFEETGLNVQITRAIGIYYPLCRLASLTYTFECAISDGCFTLSDETTEIQFFSLDALPQYLPPPYPDWIRDGAKNNPKCQVLPISSVTYKALLSFLVRYPKLVSTFLISRIKKVPKAAKTHS